MSANALSKSLWRLVTVNPQPERAQRVVSQVAARLKDEFTIEHVGNCSAEDRVASTVQSLQPDLLFCASSWSPEESARIVAAAQDARPGLRAYAVPNGLHGAGGPEAVVAHLVDKVRQLVQ